MNSNTLTGFEKFVAGSLKIGGSTEKAWVVIKDSFDVFEVSGSEFEKSKKRIENNLKEIETLNDIDFKKYLEKAIDYIAKKDRGVISEALSIVICSDGVLQLKECNFLALVGKMFEIDTGILLFRLVASWNNNYKSK
ncbi:MAG: hypothetical protein NTW25_14505 [Candidatus Kapabacteria bacterium]|nr:hypothetical protein [Candidatus Kapabacteria bacterium]